MKVLISSRTPELISVAGPKNDGHLEVTKAKTGPVCDISQGFPVN